MQVKDLIELLQDMDPEATVHFAYNYGNRARTMVTPEITSVDYQMIAPNSYVDDMAMIDESDDNDNAIEAVVLS